MTTSRRRPRGERGASAVEFALVMPLLFLLVFGMIDFGWAINRYTVLNNATREGVRLASLGGSQADVTASVKSALEGMNINTAAVSVDVKCLSPAGTACGGWDADHVSGGIAIVTVSYAADWITPVGSTFDDSLNISKTSRMRIE